MEVADLLRDDGERVELFEGPFGYWPFEGEVGGGFFHWGTEVDADLDGFAGSHAERALEVFEILSLFSQNEVFRAVGRVDCVEALEGSLDSAQSSFQLTSLLRRFVIHAGGRRNAVVGKFFPQGFAAGGEPSLIEAQQIAVGLNARSFTELTEYVGERLKLLGELTEKTLDEIIELHLGQCVVGGAAHAKVVFDVDHLARETCREVAAHEEADVPQPFENCFLFFRARLQVADVEVN